MTYVQLMYIHLATVVPCFFMGLYLLFSTKGTPFHKTLGKIYMVLMLFTATVTLFMQAQVGPRWMNHFGWIHSFSILTIASVPRAYFSVKKGDILTHKRAMISLFIGAILIAGGFTFVPGRFLYEVFLG